MLLTISCDGKILHTENIGKRRNSFIGGIEELMQLLDQTISRMSPEQKAEVRAALDRNLPTN